MIFNLPCMDYFKVTAVMQYYWSYRATDGRKAAVVKTVPGNDFSILATVLTKEMIKYSFQLGYLKRLSRKMDILPSKGAASIPSAED